MSKITVIIKEVEEERPDCDVFFCQHKLLGVTKRLQISWVSGRVECIWLCEYHYCQAISDQFWVQNMIKANNFISLSKGTSTPQLKSFFI